MVREHFHHLLHHDHAWEHGMEKLVRNTYEFVEFLDKVLKLDLSALALPEPETITYHYTCHLRGIGVKDEGVRMLRQIGNVDFKPMEKTDQCCGFGGTFAVKNADTSTAMLTDKMWNVLGTGAEFVTAGDNSCLMHIGGGLSRLRSGVRAVHLAEILASTEEEPWPATR